MVSIDEIKAAIPHLSLSERAEIAQLLHGWEDDEWDTQMKADAAGGKFDEILKQIDKDIDEGNLREMP